MPATCPVTMVWEFPLGNSIRSVWVSRANEGSAEAASRIAAKKRRNFMVCCAEPGRVPAAASFSHADGPGRLTVAYFVGEDATELGAVAAIEQLDRGRPVIAAGFDHDLFLFAGPARLLHVRKSGSKGADDAPSLANHDRSPLDLDRQGLSMGGSGWRKRELAGRCGRVRRGLWSLLDHDALDEGQRKEEENCGEMETHKVVAEDGEQIPGFLAPCGPISLISLSYLSIALSRPSCLCVLSSRM